MSKQDAATYPFGRGGAYGHGGACRRDGACRCRGSSSTSGDEATAGGSTSSGVSTVYLHGPAKLLRQPIPEAARPLITPYGDR